MYRCCLPKLLQTPRYAKRHQNHPTPLSRLTRHRFNTCHLPPALNSSPAPLSPIFRIFQTSTLLLSRSLALLSRSLSIAVIPFVNVIHSFLPLLESPYVAPLYFLEFLNNHSIFVALVDNGSQLNVIDRSVLPFIKYAIVPSPPSIPSFQGPQGIKSEINLWICFHLHLANGSEIPVIAAVVDSLPSSIILGQPFLTSNKAQLDFRNAVLTTAGGPIRLLSSNRAPTSPKVNTILSEELAMNIKDTNLTAAEEEKLRHFLCNYQSFLGGQRTGQAKHVQHRIRLDTNHPITDCPRHHTTQQNEEAATHVRKMLDGVIIRPSNSPYASEVVMAKKQDSDGNLTGWRFCIDYRLINKHTIRDAYPMPRIIDLLHTIRKSCYFVALDLRAGYWQIPVEEESRKYTAFRCILGLFEFIVMPFGLTNAPATFQRLVDFLFGDLRHEGVLVYLDDILIHGQTFEKTLGKLKIVLDRLQAEGLTVNLEKSNFLPRTLKYLGHVVGSGQLKPNPAKVATLDQLKEPRTIYEVRRLLGMLGYYHPYIRDFCGLMAPVFNLLKGTKNNKRTNKSEAIVWEDRHRSAMREALERLKTSVLTIPLDSDDFILETDASDTAVGAIVSCKQADNTWAPIEFASKALSATERRWPVRDREAFAIIFGLKKFDAWETICSPH